MLSKIGNNKNYSIVMFSQRDHFRPAVGMIKESGNSESNGGHAEKDGDMDTVPLRSGDEKSTEPQLTYNKEIEEALVKTIEPPDGGK